MPRIPHHINDIDQQLASRNDLKVQLLILIRLLHHHQDSHGQVQALQRLCKTAKSVYTTIAISQRYLST